MKYGIEIEIMTYNRAEILSRWLEINFEKARALGFALAIYDSSTNDETELLVSSFNDSKSVKIKYIRVSSEVRLDEKVLMGIMESSYSYVWPIGDSRSFDFGYISSKILPFYKRGYDFMCLFSKTKLDNDGKTYYNSVDFLEECFWHATLLGGIIFNKTVFEPLHDEMVKKQFLEKYNRNDGFSYLGIFYDLIAGKKIKASFSVIPMNGVIKGSLPGWLSVYMDVWCGNLVYLIDNMDEIYDPVKAKVLKETWHILSLDGPYLIYKARQKGGVSKEIIQKYDELGYINRVTDQKNRMIRYATLPAFFMDSILFVSRIKLKLQKMMQNNH